MRATSPAPYREGHAWVTVKGRFAPILSEARPGSVSGCSLDGRRPPHTRSEGPFPDWERA